MFFWNVDPSNLALRFGLERFLNEAANNIKDNFGTRHHSKHGHIVGVPFMPVTHLVMEPQDSESGLQKNDHRLLERASRFQNHFK